MGGSVECKMKATAEISEESLPSTESSKEEPETSNPDARENDSPLVEVVAANEESIESRIEPTLEPNASSSQSSHPSSGEVGEIERHLLPSYAYQDARDPNPEEINAFLNIMNGMVIAHEFMRGLSPAVRSYLESLSPQMLYVFLLGASQNRYHTTSRVYIQNTQECVFCKNNGEMEAFYKSHVVKNKEGRVTCPVLRSFQCPRCGATGDFAHTIKYCPLQRYTW